MKYDKSLEVYNLVKKRELIESFLGRYNNIDDNFVYFDAYLFCEEFKYDIINLCETKEKEIEAELEDL